MKYRNDNVCYGNRIILRCIKQIIYRITNRSKLGLGKSHFKLADWSQSCVIASLFAVTNGNFSSYVGDVINASEIRHSIFVKTWSLSDYSVKVFTFIIHLDCLCVIEKYSTQLTHYSSTRDTIMVVTKIDHNTTTSVFIDSRGLEIWFILFIRK